MAVDSVAHPEENLLSSPNAIAQANLRSSQQNSSVSYRYKYVLAVADDQQAQQSMSGVFANAQNTLITGGSFVVSFVVVVSVIFVLILFTEQLECQYSPC